MSNEVIYVIVDTSKVEDVKLVDVTLDTYGTVDVLFNNAGALSVTLAGCNWKSGIMCLM